MRLIRDQPHKFQINSIRWPLTRTNSHAVTISRCQTAYHGCISAGILSPPTGSCKMAASRAASRVSQSATKSTVDVKGVHSENLPVPVAGNELLGFAELGSDCKVKVT
ncbi:hypothetical protein HN011_004575 [Eciton burchellii]|nr:hypothetical protein HN011_004575 [Eciton burchellii]